MDITWILLKW